MPEPILPSLKPIPTKDRISAAYAEKGNIDVLDGAFVVGHLGDTDLRVSEGSHWYPSRQSFQDYTLGHTIYRLYHFPQFPGKPLLLRPIAPLTVITFTFLEGI